MKKIYLILIMLLSVFMFSCKTKQRDDIVKITYKTVDYNGGYTMCHVIDLETNEYKALGYFPSLDEEEYKLEKVFTDEEEKEFIEGINKCGLLGIKEEYSRTGIIDGGGWTLTIDFADGTSFISKGNNSAPNRVFDACSTYFYDLCGKNIIGQLPSYYKDPPNISFSFHYRPDENTYYSSNALARVILGNYKWNKTVVENINYYDISIRHNNFEEGYDYELVLYTTNYDYKEKFTKIIVTEYDFNEELSNEKEIYSSGWFNQIELKIELNKIYVYKLIYNNGYYAEYTFSTSISEGPVE